MPAQPAEVPAMRVRNRVHGKRRARQRQEKKNNELEPNYASHEVASVWGFLPLNRPRPFFRASTGILSPAVNRPNSGLAKGHYLST